MAQIPLSTRDTFCIRISRPAQNAYTSWFYDIVDLFFTLLNFIVQNSICCLRSIEIVYNMRYSTIRIVCQQIENSIRVEQWDTEENKNDMGHTWLQQKKRVTVSFVRVSVRMSCVC